MPTVKGTDHLRYTLILFLILFSVTLSACTKSTTGSFSQNTTDVTIEFKDGAYNPNNTTIKVDQTITFSNNSDDLIWPASNIHPTHGIYPQFDPQKPIKAGDSWSFTFTKVGIWKFHDHLQPAITATITVE